jgi:hypothetical protein
MQSETPLILFLIAIGLVAVSNWVEAALSIWWNRTYFTRGLPVMSLQIPVVSYHTNLPAVPRLEVQFRSVLTGSVVFRQIAPDTYGFRGKLFDFALLRVGGHGMLFFDRGNSRIILKGFMGLGELLLYLFLLILLAGGLLNPTPWIERLLPLGCVGSMIGIPYLIYLRRCAQVANFAASAWARTYSPQAGAADEP